MTKVQMKQEIVNPVVLIPLSAIKPFEGQPRIHFDPEKLNGLAASMKRIGQKVPVTVVPDGPNKYEIVDGERRWRAAAIAGIESLKAIVEPRKPVEEQFEDSAIFNFCREEHTHLETSRMLVRLRKARGYTYRDLAERFGKSPQWVWMYVSLENLSPVVVAKYTEGENSLSMSTLVELAKFPQPAQVVHAQHIAAKGMSVVTARLYLEGEARKAGKSIRSADWSPRKLFQRITSFLGTVQSRTEGLMTIDRRELESALLSRKAGERKAMVEEINESIQSLEILRSAVERSLLTAPIRTPSVTAAQ